MVIKLTTQKIFTSRFQKHKYKNGHQLIASTVELERVDQDTVDRLSDISGQVRPGEVFAPYVTCYPLPSQKYFVVARTWQDLIASRAGCVFTLSIIVPIDEWALTNNILDIFNELFEFPIELEGIGDSGKSNPITNPALQNNFTNELVEALFLEQRKPILVFNCNYATLIIIKLYSAFWPNQRRIFSSCSFALSHRSINGQSFDLLFTNSDLRQRFADWKGRKIDATSGEERIARHRWTKDLADRIFKSSPPTLFPRQKTNPFNFNDLADESMLRLSLLWDELLLKVEIGSSPYAILGLLDIINSQTVFADNLYSSIEPHIIDAISNAIYKTTHIEAWKFYSALLTKHKRKKMNRSMLSLVKEACTRLTVIDPELAISFISNINPITENVPTILYAALGDGYAQLENSAFVQLVSTVVVPDYILLFLAASKAVSNKFMYLIANGHDLLFAVIENSFIGQDCKAEKRAKNNLCIYIKSSLHIPVVDFLLKDCDNKLYDRILLFIGKNTNFDICDFDMALITNAERLDRIEFFKETLLLFDKNTVNVNRIIIKLAQRNNRVIYWICFTSDLSLPRKIYLLEEILNPLTQGFIQLFSTDTQLSNNILSIFRDNKKDDTSLYAKVLVTSNVPENEVLMDFSRLTDTAINSIEDLYVAVFLVKAFSKNTSSYSNLLESFIFRVAQFRNLNYLDYIVVSNMTPSHVICNIKILLNCGEKVSSILSDNINYLSYLITENLQDKIDNYLFANWVRIFRNAHDEEKKRKAAAIIVDYSYKCRHSDPTNLLVVAFPVVYQTFITGNSVSQKFSYLFFPERDKCKTLRKDLVSHYIDSNWSRLGLLQVAIAAGILQEILDILKKSKRGKKYINKAMVEANAESKNHPVFIEMHKISK